VRRGLVRGDGGSSGGYSLDQLNEGYADLMDGKNIRGVLIHEH
jgi:alcohol dehydrogenase (nicotinoprotein)